LNPPLTEAGDGIGVVPSGRDAAGGVRRRAGRGARLRFGLALGLPMAAWQAAFFVVPIGFLVAMTFWSVKSFRLQPDFTIANWAFILQAGFFRSAYLTTLALSLGAAVLASLIALPMAYLMAFVASPATRRLLVALMVVPFFTSLPVRIYALQVVFSPQGVLNFALAPLGLGPVTVLNTMVGTVIGYLTLTLPLVVLIQSFALGAVDRTLIEAAHNLGCGRLRTVFTVVLPAARIGLVLAGAFAFVLAFGDYISPQFLGGSRPPTLSILIADQVKSGNHWPRASVVAVIMIATLALVLGALTRLAYGARTSAS
jgi:ABC-type spermidine/putrescine transport system permease subunit I